MLLQAMPYLTHELIIGHAVVHGCYATIGQSLDERASLLVEIFKWVTNVTTRKLTFPPNTRPI